MDDKNIARNSKSYIIHDAEDNTTYFPMLMVQYVTYLCLHLIKLVKKYITSFKHAIF